jgi:ferredoxin
VGTHYRVKVDRSVCQGSGLCAGIAPSYFALDGTHRSAPLVEIVQADDVLLDVAQCCPTEAITIVDDSTGEVVAGP